MLDPDNIDFIPLTQGMYAIVDMVDSERVNKYEWHAHRQRNITYAMGQTKIAGRWIHINMGRFILGVKGGIIDHINGDGLDNRRENLRVCSCAQNAQNKMKGTTRTFSSKYKGVTIHKKGRWQSGIYVNKKHVFLGLFVSEKDAALAYDVAAKKYFGEYARPNFPL